MKEITIYAFDELPEDVQKTVIERMRYHVAEDLDIWTSTDFYETSKEVCKVFGLYTKRNYYEFKADEWTEPTNVKEWVKTSLKYAKYFKCLDELDWIFTGTYADNAVCAYISEVLNSQSEIDLDDFLEGLGYALKKQLEDEQEYNCSDEQVRQFIIANDMYFSENGVKIL